MKKLYSLLIASIFSLFVSQASATCINVSVASFSFTPTTFTANIGDSIVWTLTSGTHNVTSTSVPSGAASITSSNFSTPGAVMYTYVVTTAGSYAYKCSLHSSMIATFTVLATGIAANTNDLATKVYPNPFNDRITIKYNGIESIELMNVIGGLVKKIDLASSEGKLEVYLEELPAGVYFYRTYKEGTILETRKLVKSK